MYCQNCGSKVSEDMDYCQTCGAKLAKDSEPAKAPAAPVPEVQGNPNKPVKKSASVAKLAVAAALVLLFGIIMVVVVMGIFGRDSGGKSGRVADEDFDDDAVPKITLSKTYVDDAEGFSFQYPDGWVVEDVEDWLDEAGIEPDDMDVSIIMVLSHTSLALEIRTSMIIEKSDADESYFYATASDYKEVFSASYPDYKMISLTDVTIDGRRAKKHVFKYDNDNGQDCVAIQYFYIANSNLYCVGCYSIESNFDINEPIYDAVIGSYTIAAADMPGENADSGNLCYKDVFLPGLLNKNADEVRNALGFPTSGTPVDGEMLYGGTEYYGYDGLTLYFDNQGMVMQIYVQPDKVKINGKTLDKTRSELIGFLGQPDYEENFGGIESEIDPYYYMQYTMYEEGFLFDIEMLDENSKAYGISIYKYEDGWGWEEPDDSYPALGYGLEWVEAPYITIDSLGYSVINGVIENTSGSSKSWVMLTFNLYDANGYQIDQAVDSIQNLRSGGKWKFKATIWNKDAAYWELVDVTVW